MTKYSELREILKEDIHEIVEQEIALRLHTVIQALMPSVLEHVANSLEVCKSPAASNYYEPSLETAQLAIHTEPGHTRYVSVPFTTVNQHYYATKWNSVDQEFIRLQNRIHNLEHPQP